MGLKCRNEILCEYFYNEKSSTKVLKNSELWTVVISSEIHFLGNEKKKVIYC